LPEPARGIRDDLNAGQRLRTDPANLAFQGIGCGAGFFDILVPRDGHPHRLIQAERGSILRFQRAGNQCDYGN